MSDVPYHLGLTSPNRDLLRRLDADQNGIITRRELLAEFRAPSGEGAAPQRSNHSRWQNEAQDMTPQDRAIVAAARQTAFDPSQAAFLDAPVVALHTTERRHGDEVTRDIGPAPGQVSWSRAAERLALDESDQPAPIGSVGQERPYAMHNGDCGPAAAVYLQERRLQTARRQSGLPEPPLPTHHQRDEAIQAARHAAAAGRQGGTSSQDMLFMLGRHFAHAGGQHYTYQRHDVAATYPLDTLLRQGLRADPAGGVMVWIASLHNRSDQSGEDHWIAVTGLDADGTVHYYDPGGPDGGSHEHTMPGAELGDAFSKASDPHLIWGAPTREQDASGRYGAGTPVATQTRGVDDRIEIVAPAGVFGSRTAAERRAAELAAHGQPATVIREGESHAVYQITAIETTEPEFLVLSPAIQAIYWPGDGATPVRHRSFASPSPAP